MKRFIRKIILFIAPGLAVLCFIFSIKTDREFCYNYVKGDCNQRGELLYKKIYEDPNKVNCLFIGSSKTWNDINDGLLQDLVNKSGQSHLKLFNAGYCRFGRNLDYLYCKEFMKRNYLKKVFLEVRTDESTSSHPIFPFLANGKEVLEGALAWNGRLFPEVYDHLLMNITYSRCLLGFEKTVRNPASPPAHGYDNIEKTMSPELLDRFYKEELDKINAARQSDIAYHFSWYYIKRIKELCDKKKTELIFVFIPSYGNVSKTPAFYEEYKKMGRVILGPDSIFLNKAYWKDAAHFNASGATAFTKFLATQL
jgi:hypothetical protein